MAKKNSIIFDDDADQLSQQIEGGSKANTATKAKADGKGNQQNNTAPVNTPVSTVNTRERRNLIKKEKDKSALWKRDKNPLYDMECCIHQKYVKDGELASAQIYKEFIMPLKEYALKKKTGIRDLINIAIYQFGVKEGFFKPGDEHAAK